MFIIILLSFSSNIPLKFFIASEIKKHILPLLSWEVYLAQNILYVFWDLKLCNFHYQIFPELPLLLNYQNHQIFSRVKIIIRRFKTNYKVSWKKIFGIFFYCSFYLIIPFSFVDKKIRLIQDQ